MARHHFINLRGRVVVAADHDFTRAAERALDAIGRGRAHMRTAHCTVIVFDSVNEVVICPTMYAGFTPDQIVERGSDQWAASRRDRLSQLARMERALTLLEHEHPIAPLLRDDIQRERQSLRRGKYARALMAYTADESRVDADGAEYGYEGSL